MAHQPAIRLDPSSYDPPEEPRGDEQINESEDPSRVLAELARALTRHGGGSAATDLALDLVLNEIVQQARLATTASGAAVALFREGELIVRATTGTNAPELGVRLSTQAGLSGACLHTREAQVCNDIEKDSRVDPSTCAELGIESILAVPVIDDESVVGILEIFSDRSHAFGDRDEQTLEALSRRIVNTIHSAESPEQATPEPEQQATEWQPEIPAPSTDEPAQPVNSTADAVPRARKKEYGTQVLTFALIAVALLLGWMIGVSTWQSSQQQPSTQSPAAAVMTTPSTAHAEGTAEEPSAPREAKAAKANSTKPTADAAPAPGLVIYDKGKVVFESASRRVKTSDKPDVSKISSSFAGGLLLNKVQPQYPDSAREQHIEGPVVLEIIVGTHGSVQEVNVKSGTPELADAAVAAVRQWQFRPYTPQGKPTAFETSVTVKFTLAEEASEAKNP
jgi:TonB family protein